MRAGLVLLVASLATSAMAAPVPAVAPFERPESLMERDNRRPARLEFGKIPPGLELNARDDSWQGRRDDDLSELDEGNADGADDNDNVELEKRRHGGFKKGMDQRQAKEIDENDNVELEKVREAEVINREAVQRLEAIVQRSEDQQRDNSIGDGTDTNEKRRLAKGVAVPPTVNYRSDSLSAEHITQDVNDEPSISRRARGRNGSSSPTYKRDNRGRNGSSSPTYKRDNRGRNGSSYPTYKRDNRGRNGSLSPTYKRDNRGRNGSLSPTYKRDDADAE